MLHIDRETEEFFRKMDEDILASTNLTGGSRPSVSASSGIRSEVVKVFKDIEYDWEQHYDRVGKGLRSFENKLIRALSDPIPTRYIGKPRPFTRKLPYKVTGQLSNRANFLRSRSITKDETNNTWTTLVEMEFLSEHAGLTNDGINSSRPVHWLHWVDNILGTNLPSNALHSSKVPDIRSILLGYYS